MKEDTGAIRLKAQCEEAEKALPDALDRLKNNTQQMAQAATGIRREARKVRRSISNQKIAIADIKAVK